jgi:hypothetical protein
MATLAGKPERVFRPRRRKRGYLTGIPQKADRAAMAVVFETLVPFFDELPAEADPVSG